jgi:tetratricopeptide (TPR) repeat protein
MLAKNWERAEEVLWKAQEIAGEKMPRTHTLLGEVYKYIGQYEKAEQQYNIAISKWQDMEAMSYLADLQLNHLKDYDEAEKTLLEILIKDNSWNLSQKALAFGSLGDLYLKKDQFQKAEAAYDSAIVIIPQYTNFYIKKARLYKEYGFFDKAEDYYKIAIQKEVSSANIDFYQDELFRMYLISKQIDKAKDLFPKVASNPSLYYYLAKYYLESGDLSTMEQTIQDGIERHLQDDLLFYNNACLYSLAKKEREAIAQLKLAFDKGYNDYEHLQNDQDLEAIRDTQGFDKMMEDYIPDQKK